MPSADETTAPPRAPYTLEGWRSGRCRIEDGLFLADDTFYMIDGSLSEGYLIKVSSQPMVELMAQDAEDWCELDVQVRCADARGDLFGGEGSWEGEGFVACCEPGDELALRWLLHMSDMERVVALSWEGEQVLIHTSDPPQVWAIRFDPLARTLVVTPGVALQRV